MKNKSVSFNINQYENKTAKLQHKGFNTLKVTLNDLIFEYFQ